MGADNDSPSAAEPISTENSPGKLLRELREAAGLTQAYMAEQMRVNEGYIVYLENDDFAKLPSEPYVLGYYRTCARILNIAPDQLISRYRQLRQQGRDDDESASFSVTSPGHSSFPRKPMRLNQNTKLAGKAKSSSSRIYLLIALVLVAIWLAVSLLAGKTDQVVSVGAEGAAVQISMPDSAPALAIDNVVEGVTEGAEGNAVDTILEQTAEQTAERMGESGNANSDAVDGTPAEDSVRDDFVRDDSVREGAGLESAALETNTSAEPAPTSNEAAEAELAAKIVEKVVRPLDQLEFFFSDECWLEVTDANGDILAATLYQDGETAQLAGVAPFDVMMGNARATQLQLNGEAVKLNPQSNRKTLRLTVGRAAAAAE